MFISYGGVMGYIERVQVLAALQKVVGFTFKSWLKDLDQDDYEDLVEDQYEPWDIPEEDYNKELEKDFSKVIKEIPNTFPLTIYRGVEVNAEHRLALSKFGVHWTTDVSTAEYMVGGTENLSRHLHNSNSVIYKAEVSKNSVDWVQTIRHRIKYPEEHEIRLQRNMPVIISGYKNCGDKKWTRCSMKANTGDSY